MSRLLKLAAWAAAAIAVVVGAGVSYLFARYPNLPPPSAVTVASTPEKVARGQYLANHVTGCVICHAERDYTKYGGPVAPGTFGAGGDFFGDPAAGLSLYSPNITPASLRDWTDGEIIQAVTEGVSRNRHPLFPIMPYTKFGRLSQDDVEAIVAYLRSLPAVERTVPARVLPFPLPLVVRTLPQAAALRPIPAKSDRVAYGEYMTNAAVCADCHTPIDGQGVPIPGRDFAGGVSIYMPVGRSARSANITPDASSGIGTWTEDQFIEKFKAWENTEPRPLSAAEQNENTLMPWMYYAGMTREDLGAIYAYLRTVKPIINHVTKFDGIANQP